MCIWRVQVRDLKAGAARLATLGGDDPLAAALQAGPPAGFAQPASRRRAAAANSDGGFGRGGRFNRSPIFNKPAANARKHTWDEDEEDEIEDDEEEGGDPYSFAGSTDGNNQSVAAHLESPRARSFAPISGGKRQAAGGRGRGRGRGKPASGAKSKAKSQAPGSAPPKKRARKQCASALPLLARSCADCSDGSVCGRRYNRWTEQENQNLREGVENYGTRSVATLAATTLCWALLCGRAFLTQRMCGGACRWSTILQNYEFNDRSGVDLKDRWRNIQKAA